MATFAQSTDLNWNPWTSSAEDSPARTYRKPENESASRELAQACGLSTPVWFGNFDLDTCSLRTSQGSLFQTQCDELSENWPDSGMWDAGAVYELQNSEPVTCESESSSWPTPRTTDTQSGRLVIGKTRFSKNGEKYGANLSDFSERWPTATGGDSWAPSTDESAERETAKHNLRGTCLTWPTARAEDSESCGNHPGATDSLTGATRNWPTPQRHDAQGAKTPEQIEAMREKNGAGVQNLNESAEHWMTPNSRDWKSETGSENNNYDKTPNLSRQVYRMENWATPRLKGDHDGARATSTTRHQGDDLYTQAESHFNSLPAPVTPDGPSSSESVQTSRRLWQTPKDVTSGANQQRGGDRKDELLLTGQAAEFMGNRTRRLNPRFVEWLMGFPISWTEL